MSDDFISLKRNSKNLLSEFSEQAKKLNVSSYEKDERYWSLTPDKLGNGRATIRFLPPSKGENTPFVKLFTHGFNNGSSWYIENCPTTVNLPCPVCENNSELWNQAEKEQPEFDKHPLKEVVRKRKRKLSYVSNIYVVKDDTNPENNGKVFLFKYGKQIFNKISSAMNPQYEDEQKINPFDFWEGANFVLKQKLKDKYPNFEDSAFATKTSPILDNDEGIKEIWQKQHKLSEIVAHNQFKSYEDLTKSLKRVLKDETVGKSSKAENKSAKIDVDDDSVPFDVEVPSRKETVNKKTPEDFFNDLMED
jgi:hypothetical protein